MTMTMTLRTKALFATTLIHILCIWLCLEAAHGASRPQTHIPRFYSLYYGTVALHVLCIVSAFLVEEKDAYSIRCVIFCTLICLLGIFCTYAATLNAVSCCDDREITNEACRTIDDLLYVCSTKEDIVFMLANFRDGPLRWSPFSLCWLSGVWLYVLKNHPKTHVKSH
jgi:hypothetical protein